MTQIIRMPRAAWLAHFHTARKAGNKSRAVKRAAEARLAAEIERTRDAKPALRKTPKPPSP